MELRWLQDFLMVAETGNFTRAAERRNTSQAAFSRRIKSLEAWLGFDLIDRSVYPTQLTPQGERFREHAGELLRQMLDSRDELGGKPLRSHEHIRIALPFAMATAQLPQWWQAWSAERRMSCSVVVGNIHDLVTSLVSGNADLMISESVETIVQQKLRPGLCAVNPDKPLQYGEMAWLLPRDDVAFKSYVDQWLHLSQAGGEFQRVMDRWLK